MSIMIMLMTALLPSLPLHTHLQEDLRNNASPVTQSPTPLPVPHTGRSNLSNLSVCSACLPQYQQLLTYYEQYKKDIENKGCTVCADIADHVSMGRTAGTCT